tara:strand:+ start:46 stop:804 length:759 start_codon:yes stop_codon:yes gene_type:complete
MKLIADVSFDSSLSFDEPQRVSIDLEFKNGDNKRYSGELKRTDVAIGYLSALYFYATKTPDIKRSIKKSLDRAKKGRIIYEIQVKATGEDLETLRDNAKRIQFRKFILPRDEWVRDEEYCTFFGSAAGLWDPEKCDYKAGNFIELIRQTVYDMNTHPQLDHWSNVPRMHYLSEVMGRDSRFLFFIKHIARPLELKLMDKGNSTVRMQILTQIADEVEEYAKQNQIDPDKLSRPKNPLQSLEDLVRLLPSQRH